METAKLANSFLTGADRKMVRVAKYHLRAGRLELADLDAFDGTLRADWHKGRSLHRPARRAKCCSARGGIGVAMVKCELELRHAAFELVAAEFDSKLRQLLTNFCQTSYAKVLALQQIVTRLADELPNRVES